MLKRKVSMPIGAALHDSKRDKEVVIVQRPGVTFKLGIAGEQLSRGDLLIVGKAGKLYKYKA